MKLSYKDPETEKLPKKTLVEYVIGVTPETTIGKVHVDGLFPASQFHFRVDERITEEQKAKIEGALKIPFCGMIHTQIFSGRVIITTACPAKEREHWAKEFAKAINDSI